VHTKPNNPHANFEVCQPWREMRNRSQTTSIDDDFRRLPNDYPRLFNDYPIAQRFALKMHTPPIVQRLQKRTKLLISKKAWGNSIIARFYPHG